jgi:hypothetical protein
MADLAAQHGFPRRAAAAAVWYAGEIALGARPAFVYAALARDSSLAPYPWGRWVGVEDLAGEAISSAAALAIRCAYQFAAPQVPLFTAVPDCPVRQARNPSLWARQQAEHTAAAVEIRERLERSPSARIREWSRAVRPGLPDDVPPEARGIAIADEASLDFSALADTHPRFRAPITIAPGPAPDQDRSVLFRRSRGHLRAVGHRQD